MKPLFLEDLKDLTPEKVREHIINDWTASESELAGVEILIAYESVGSWGCDSTGWFLLRKDGRLYEVHGSHCSCFGFEDQWSMEITTAHYLTSDKFTFSTGGYDNDAGRNLEAAKNWIKENIIAVEPS